MVSSSLALHRELSGFVSTKQFASRCTPTLVYDLRTRRDGFLQRLVLASEQDIDVHQDLAHLLRNLRCLDVHIREHALHLVEPLRAERGRPVALESSGGGIEQRRHEHDAECLRRLGGGGRYGTGQVIRRAVDIVQSSEQEGSVDPGDIVPGIVGHRESDVGTIPQA